jgi:hypothetical protein
MMYSSMILLSRTRRQISFIANLIKNLIDSISLEAIIWKQVQDYVNEVNGI